MVSRLIDEVRGLNSQYITQHIRGNKFTLCPLRTLWKYMQLFVADISLLGLCTCRTSCLGADIVVDMFNCG